PAVNPAEASGAPAARAPGWPALRPCVLPRRLLPQSALQQPSRAMPAPRLPGLVGNTARDAQPVVCAVAGLPLSESDGQRAPSDRAWARAGRLAPGLSHPAGE